MNSSSDNTSAKKACPYMEKCYRKNPIHFNEMSHPHLEKLVRPQLVGDIQIPDHLDFECTDRSLLMDQLKVLQMVLRKQGNNNGKNSLVTTTDQNLKYKTISSAVPSTSNSISEDVKVKVERRKQQMMQRRENKLKEMDAKVQAFSKPSTSNERDEPENKKVCKMRKELDNLKIAEEQSGKGNSPQGKKRYYENSMDNQIEKKKTKSGHSNHGDSSRVVAQNSGTSDRQESTSSSKGSSLMDVFTSSNCGKSRDAVRKKAIEMMKRHGFEISVVEPGNFAMKYALSAPYHLFFSRVQKSKPTYDQRFSITFPEILDQSLGEIVDSLQINFMVDVGWLCLQYLLAGQRTDMLILYGERVDEEKLNSNIVMVHVETASRFGCHHTKVMILKYKDDGIRVVVSTANLYSDDWDNRTQGVWISPHLPPLPESANTSDGESPTGFKKDFLRYLLRYNQPVLTEWTSTVRRADFSAVNVFFLASVPGSHSDADADSWGHRKLGSVLSRFATLPADAPQWPIIAQSSSIGSLGPNYGSWLMKEIVPCMSRETAKGLKSHPNFQFIYPSINNFKESFDCRNGSCCLPYSLQTHSKQEWIKSYLYQWKASRTARDKAMPHIKSYTRLSPDSKRIPWFVLTSANLSKAAWGTARNTHYIMSYEAGVIFLPKFITGSTTFPVRDEEAGVPVFPIPYDIPLTRYGPEDTPFVTEFFQGHG